MVEFRGLLEYGDIVSGMLDSDCGSESTESCADYGDVEYRLFRISELSGAAQVHPLAG